MNDKNTTVISGTATYVSFIVSLAYSINFDPTGNEFSPFIIKLNNRDGEKCDLLQSHSKEF